MVTRLCRSSCNGNPVVFKKILFFIHDSMRKVPKIFSFLLICRAGHSLLFTLFANRYSTTSMYHFAIATPLLF
jgi:hypothetical protein